MSARATTAMRGIEYTPQLPHTPRLDSSALFGFDIVVVVVVFLFFQDPAARGDGDAAQERPAQEARDEAPHLPWAITPPRRHAAARLHPVFVRD